MTITSDIKYIGVNDYKIDLFESMYKVPNGMAYNSYVIMDEKTVVMDTVDVEFTNQWLSNLQNVLENRKLDYLIVQHMEPDHSANIMSLIERYPETTIVASEKAFAMMNHFFGSELTENRMIVSDGDVLWTGKHKLTFISAPMVHWPEVIMTYDYTEKVLFSADGFGKFGALDVNEGWVDEARRYYFGIVGKYGVYVQKLLNKIKGWDIERIYPLHGPMLLDNISYYVGLYNTWSTYMPEEEGIFIAYASVYGNTKKGAMLLKDRLEQRGYTKVIVKDIARCDMSEAVADAFRYSKLVLASITYNAGIFPPMRQFINSLTERNFSNRLVALIENGSFASNAAKQMKESFAKSKGIVFADNLVTVVSALNEDSIGQIEKLADELCNHKRNS